MKVRQKSARLTGKLGAGSAAGRGTAQVQIIQIIECQAAEARDHGSGRIDRPDRAITERGGAALR